MMDNQPITYVTPLTAAMLLHEMLESCVLDLDRMDSSSNSPETVCHRTTEATVPIIPILPDTVGTDRVPDEKEIQFRTKRVSEY
ncbi:hypothetical protein TNCT_208571 [Trichonephila clavata]|uniref:Uncharacterized protein n=1 Tax=Trichonephila clavata TaxID=2740835 RepID=A0A8X6LVV2_TRICU|nr:hypothetical protein TNCT_208571 [Trichonephila clavata]